MRPQAQMELALESRDPEVALKIYDNLTGSVRSLIKDIYWPWIATVQEFIYDRYGHEGLTKSVPVAALISDVIRPGANIDKTLSDDSYGAMIKRLIEAGDIEGAKKLYADQERDFRRTHDFYIDLLTLFLSHLYREYGLDSLEQCFRFTGEKLFEPWMMDEIRNEPKTRIENTIRLLLSHFFEISIEEDDEKFIITATTCGSCGRQIKDRCYEQPLNMAVISEKHPVTFNREGITVYQAHMAVIHTIMPIERIGAPWPVILCSGQAKANSPCYTMIYKNPLTAAPEHYEMVGMKPVS